MPGDFNLDGHVNAGDISAMQQALTNLSGYEKSHGGIADPQVTSIGDLNSDGRFTDADFQSLPTFLKNGSGSAATVPEPAMLTLLGLALSACGFFLAQRP